MSSRSRNWRRQVGGIGFVLAVAWLASRACKSEMTSAELSFRVGEVAADVLSLRADLFRGDDPELIGYYERAFGQGGAPEVIGPWPLTADGGMYRVVVVVKSAGARAVTERAVELRDGGHITVDLSSDLARELVGATDPAPSGERTAGDAEGDAEGDHPPGHGTEDRDEVGEGAAATNGPATSGGRDDTTPSAPATATPAPE